MKQIIQIITKFFKDPPKQLGRWNIESCTQKMNTKIDLSNEDHCGPCGQYIISKQTTTIISKETVADKNGLENKDK